jgi:hypothetical protein
MNAITSREFQSNYQRLVEPVIVKAKSRTLGTWYPAGTEPAEVWDRTVNVDRVPRPTVSKPRTAVRAGVDRTLNNAPFTPVLK